MSHKISSPDSSRTPAALPSSTRTCAGLGHGAERVQVREGPNLYLAATAFSCEQSGAGGTERERMEGHRRIGKSRADDFAIGGLPQLQSIGAGKGQQLAVQFVVGTEGRDIDRGMRTGESSGGFQI